MADLPRFLTDEKGQRIAVVIPIEEYERMLEELEDAEDVRAYDEAKASGETPVPYQGVQREIERSRP